MIVKQIDPGYLNGWLEGLLLNQTLIAPVEHSGHFAFETISRVSDIRLDYDVTALPPKKFLLPAKEVLVTFHNGSHYQSVFQADPFILFGVHPYDMKAISQMDQVTQTTAANAEEGASASEELSAQAETLAQVVQDLERLIGSSSNG